MSNHDRNFGRVGECPYFPYLPYLPFFSAVGKPASKGAGMACPLI